MQLQHVWFAGVYHRWGANHSSSETCSLYTECTVPLPAVFYHSRKTYKFTIYWYLSTTLTDGPIHDRIDITVVVIVRTRIRVRSGTGTYQYQFDKIIFFFLISLCCRSGYKLFSRTHFRLIYLVLTERFLFYFWNSVFISILKC